MSDPVCLLPRLFFQVRGELLESSYDCGCCLQVQDQLNDGKVGDKYYNTQHQQQEQQLFLDGHAGQAKQRGQQAVNGLAPDSPIPGQQANGQWGKEEMCIDVPDVAR